MLEKVHSAWQILIGIAIGVFVTMTDPRVDGGCLRYSITLTSPNPCTPFVTTTPYGLNESHDIVGENACGEVGQAFVAWNAGMNAPLNLPNTYWSIAYGISNAQHIVGTMELNGVGIRAFLYANGVPTNIGTLSAGAISEAYGINDFDVIVGMSDVDGSVNHAFRWESGVISDLNLPIGPNGAANDIGSNGQIVGWMGVGPGGSFYAEGFSWIDGVTTALGVPFGATNSQATAVNNYGLICGIYAYPNPNGGFIRRGVLWSKRGATDLGVLPNFLRTNAFDINDAGDIVGHCDNPPPLNNLRAFIWHDGAIMSLQDLLAPEWSAFHIRYARAINSQGEIAVEVSGPGAPARAALLTPVPPKVGDTNCDWVVNVDDLLNVINAWGPYAGGGGPPGGPGSPDLDANGVVNVDDLLMVINNWG